MKYWAFGYIFSHAHGGMNDRKGVLIPLKKRAQIEESAKDNMRGCDYIGHIVEVDRNATIVEHYIAHSIRDGVIDTQKWMSPAAWKAEYE